MVGFHDRYRPEARQVFPCLRVKHDAPDDDIAGVIPHNVIIVRPYSTKAFAGFNQNKLI
jgi:hypothetical protein